MKNKADFFSVLVGSNGGYLLGYIVIAAICAMIIMFIEANNRDISSPRTPEKFHMLFWFADNCGRVVANLLLIPITIRLCYEYVPPVWMLGLSAGVGFGVDGLALIAKNAGLLTTKTLADKMAAKLKGL